MDIDTILEATRLRSPQRTTAINALTRTALMSGPTHRDMVAIVSDEDTKLGDCEHTISKLVVNLPKGTHLVFNAHTDCVCGNEVLSILGCQDRLSIHFFTT